MMDQESEKKIHKVLQDEKFGKTKQPMAESKLMQGSRMVDLPQWSAAVACKVTSQYLCMSPPSSPENKVSAAGQRGCSQGLKSKGGTAA